MRGHAIPRLEICCWRAGAWIGRRFCSISPWSWPVGPLVRWGLRVCTCSWSTELHAYRACIGEWMGFAVSPPEYVLLTMPVRQGLATPVMSNLRAFAASLASTPPPRTHLRHAWRQFPTAASLSSTSLQGRYAYLCLARSVQHGVAQQRHASASGAPLALACANSLCTASAQE